MAFLVEAAGGVASDGKNRILTIQPKELHQRTPVYMGSPDDVADVLRFANA
jgi:fructose-1,6-bisphosphatase I